MIPSSFRLRRFQRGKDGVPFHRCIAATGRVDVIYEKANGVHVSGHGSQEELKLMHNLVRPKFFIPVHGEYRHLVKHAKLAESLGMSRIIF